MKIDLPPKGKAGIEAKLLAPGVVWIHGSDHWRDWLHHVLPGAKRREIEAAEAIVKAVYTPKVNRWVIGGHSLGGCVAGMVAVLLMEKGLYVECYTFGGKRVPWRWVDIATTHYRHRGDLVPFFPPWRTPHAEETLIGNWAWPWKAHGPETYDAVRRKHGLK